MSPTTAGERPHRLQVRAGAIVLALAVLVGACSSGDETSSERRRSTTSTAPAAAAVYAERGPYEAGVTDLALADGRRVVMWYPAEPSAPGQPREIFDIASLLSPELQSQVPAEKRPQYEIDAHPGAPAAGPGPFPVVVFSHGYAGFPEQSVNLTTHLARWGFIVVAPNHVERSLDGLLGIAARNMARSADPQVLSTSLDLVLAEQNRDGSPVRGRVDGTRVAVTGHSAGAGAAYTVASSDTRIRGFIAYSIGLGGGPATTAPPPVPGVPGMVMAGTTDGVIPVAATEQVFAGMRPPKTLVTITGAGHLVFSDICLIGRDQGGLVALVGATGLQLPPNLLRLAEDGCGPDALDPTKAFPAINHLSVAFLRSSLGIDPEPVGSGPDIAEAFPQAPITVRQER